MRPSTTTTTTEMWQWQCGTCRSGWKVLRQVTTTCCPHGHGGRCFQGQGTPPPPSPSPSPHCHCHRHHHHHHHRQEEVTIYPIYTSSCVVLRSFHSSSIKLDQSAVAHRTLFCCRCRVPPPAAGLWRRVPARAPTLTLGVTPQSSLLRILPLLPSSSQQRSAGCRTPT